jgi:type I restriction enzyme R subunit
MRRVKSRILYEQMIGRATRRCDEIGKTVFRIYDPVDIYAALQAINTIKLLVKDTNVTLRQLMGKLTDPEHLEKALNSPSEQEGESQADVILSQLRQKVMRVLRKAHKKTEFKPDLKQKLDELEGLWGVEPKTLLKHLREFGPQQANHFVQQHTGLLNQLAEVSALLVTEYRPAISEHPDEIQNLSQSYDNYARPEDYLDSFNQFIKD